MDNTVAIRSAVDSSGVPSAPSGASSSSSAAPGNVDEVLKQLARTRKKIETMEESLQSRLSVMANEVQ